MAKVLVVEDNMANQRLLSMVLAAMGHEVVCATTGEEGWAKVNETSFALVLLDMHLPGMDGFQLSLKIKGLYGDRIPILAVTALAMEADRRKVFESGCDGYVSKPISIPLLRNQIERLLEE